MMEKCDFCGGQVALLIEWDDDLWCDPLTDKWVCSACEGHPTFVYQKNFRIATEFWFPKEYNDKNELVMSLVVRVCHTAKPSLEILEWQHPMPKVIYRNDNCPSVTPANAKQRLETILTFQ